MLLLSRLAANSRSNQKEGSSDVLADRFGSGGHMLHPAFLRSTIL
jgi:hypothetical protein